MVDIVNKPVVMGLKPTDYVEYFGFARGVGDFIIYRPRDDWNYGDFRLLVRRPATSGFAEATIKNVTRFRDGGTTIIESELGTFTFPTPFSPELRARLNDDEIMVYDRLW